MRLKTFGRDKESVFKQRTSHMRGHITAPEEEREIISMSELVKVMIQYETGQKEGNGKIHMVLRSRKVVRRQLYIRKILHQEGKRQGK